MTRLALVAADWALADAGVDPAELAEFDMGVVTASSSGGFEFGQSELQNAVEPGQPVRQRLPVLRLVLRRQHRPDLDPARHAGPERRGGQPTRPAAWTRSRRPGGRSATARRLMVSGGVDASICPWGWVAQLAGGRLSTASDPAAPTCPSTRRAPATCPVRAARCSILEDGGVGRGQRGATVYGEIAGYGATFDPQPGSGRAPALRRAIESRWPTPAVDAGRGGRGVRRRGGLPELDRIEAEALCAVFGRAASRSPRRRR